MEVDKEDLAELTGVLELLRGRGPRFVLFVDDLSFEEHEVEYKALKALLEGSVEEPPENVRIYATSNRRNLIRRASPTAKPTTFTPATLCRRSSPWRPASACASTFPSPDQHATFK